MSAPPEPEKQVHVCSVCAQPSEATICRTCEAKIRGELLEEKHKVEREGTPDTHRH